jgi:error-prone DNA polymerase
MASGVEFAELCAHSYFSILRAASSPEELFEQASVLQYAALGISDWHSISGIVRAHIIAKNYNLKFIIGCHLKLKCDAIKKESEYIEVIAHPVSAKGYAQLCTFLSQAVLAEEKVSSLLFFLESCQDLLVTVIPPGFSSEGLGLEQPDFNAVLKILKSSVTANFLSLALLPSYNNLADYHWRSCINTSQALNIPLLATNLPCYHENFRRPLQDVLYCTRSKCSLNEAALKLPQNAERYLKSKEEIKRLFREEPRSLKRSIELAEIASQFNLDQLSYSYPTQICPDNLSPSEYLKQLTFQHAQRFHSDEIPLKIVKLLEQELSLIRELEYEKYFLTCYDITNFARSRGILCQGRGSAANSAICFYLGITSVNPSEVDLLFSRFISKARQDPPDIDIDFEHERREEVIQYIFERFGRTHAALTATTITYRPRSAIRDACRALGITPSLINKITKLSHHWKKSHITNSDLLEVGVEPTAQIELALQMAKQLLGLPRHLSQHVGGFIISETPLHNLTALLPSGMASRSIIAWNKDDLESLGILKIDILALGMLTCIRKAIHLINLENKKDQLQSLSFNSIPTEDPAVYDMLEKADSIGVFQVESRAQMSMLVRLKPRCFYDLIIQVAIVRPGPIQGDMVHPYLRRRQGVERVSFPDKTVAQILGKTLGVPLFQEQAMRLAISLAEFTPEEADQLRKALSAWRGSKLLLQTFATRVINGMKKNGYSEEFARLCLRQMRGFSEYGFPESHAASFAKLVYISAWIKRHFPEAFAAALLNSQPMGFYAPAQIIADAKRHNVQILPIDANHSCWDCHSYKAEEKSYLRVGFRLIKGFSEQDANVIEKARDKFGPFTSPEETLRYCRLINPRFNKNTIKLLSKADAFHALYKFNSRRTALWQTGLAEVQQPILSSENYQIIEPNIPRELRSERVNTDYETFSFSTNGHQMQEHRRYLKSHGILTATEIRIALEKKQEITHVKVAGKVLFRQRPQTANGILFISIEDETDTMNLVVPPNVFESYSNFLITTDFLIAFGKIEMNTNLIYIKAISFACLPKESELTRSNCS